MALAIATGLIVAAVIPWGDFQGHTHWGKVGWIPFVSPPVRLSDIVANILLFFPFGAAVALNVRGSRCVAVATASGALLSFLGEWAQLYSHTRFPSATDLVTNTVGAALGAAVLRHVIMQRDRGAVQNPEF